MQILKVEKGITVIALIITIIVMLILVGVTVTTALNGGLFDISKNAAKQKEIAIEEEQLYVAAMAAIGTDGKVDYNKLNSNLPEEIVENSGVYESVKTGRKYKVNSNCRIEVIEAIEILVAQYKTRKITIGAIVDYEQILTENKASQIVGIAFGLETNNLREFNEAFMKMQGVEMSYDEIVAAVTDLTGNPNPSDRDVFACLFSEMEIKTIEQLAGLAIEEGMATYESEIKIKINNEDKTDIYNPNGFEYDIEYGKEYKIELQVGEKTATKNVKIEEGKPYNWDTSKVDIRIEGENIIPIPKDFEVSASETEDSIDEGLVIKNGQNEFVWIPVANPYTYTETAFGILTTTDEGSKLQTDSYQNIQYYYGDTLGDMDSEDDFSKVFTFAKDQKNIERSIRTYGGFYVGRYETTYNSVSENKTVQGIGVERGQNVLRASSNYKIENGELKRCRWWGLYKAQKDMYNANSNVGSLMITVKQWDEIMKHTGYGETERGSNTYTKTPEISGAPYKGTTDVYDVAKNIYDLAGNMSEYTMNQGSLGSAKGRTWKGDGYDSWISCKASQGLPEYPYISKAYYGSRVALYIK